MTIREDFSEYEIENGQILRVKQTLSKLVNTVVEGKKKGGLAFQSVSSVITPRPIDTSTFEVAEPKDVTEQNQTTELRFRVIKEVINIYETQRVLILLIPKLERVFATNKKDKDNNPILRFTYYNEVEIVGKERTDAPQLVF